MSFRLHTSIGAFVAAATLLFACGGTVVFEEGEESGGGNGNGGSGASGDGGDALSSTATSSPANGTVGPGGPGNGSVGPGGGNDDATSVGPGPGPGPSGGGFDPTGAGSEGTAQGPSGVGGADVGPANGASATSGGGCNQLLEETNQYCYAGAFCEDFRIEVECEVDGGAPYACWCYQDGRQVAQCSQASSNLCDVDSSCCENFWVLPG